MCWVGYDASGLDLSPELVQQARERFGVPMLHGPIESHDLPEGSLDAIVLMDVLEHLGEPEETLRRCFRLLNSKGLIFCRRPNTARENHCRKCWRRMIPFGNVTTGPASLPLQQIVVRTAASEGRAEDVKQETTQSRRPHLKSSSR
jgi:2-polyprenyl-3-methyl-5-hydroxy-6-metoxy-1,4-benzoquinol methylase